jgi:hypothetical protein
MINYSNQVQLVATSNIGLDMGEALTSLMKIMKNEMGASFVFAPSAENSQYRNRFALFTLAENRSLYGFSADELDTIFKLCIKKKSDRAEISDLYAKLVGHMPIAYEDALGLRTPFRAMFMILWSQGKITLPHTYSSEGVLTKFPMLDRLTKGFIYEIAAREPEAIRASRVFQYRTNWHSPDDVSFQDVWDAAAHVSEIPDKNPKNFRYIPWLEILATVHPEIISNEQLFYLEKYNRHLHAKSKFESPLRSIKSFDDFKAYYTCTPEQAKSLSAKERERLRLEYKKEWAKNNYSSKSSERNKNIEKLILEESAPTPEALALLVRKSKKELGSFNWLNNQHYYGREHINIEDMCGAWKICAESYLKYLKQKGYSTNSKKQKVTAINILLDYLFCYLPIWFEHNPDTLVTFPLMISDFERVLFWNNSLSEEDKKGFLFQVAGVDSNMELPLTAREFHLLVYSKKTQASFVGNIHEFFEHCRADKKLINKRFHGAVSSEFVNPVNVKIDRTGSGGRGTSDKVALPLDSTIIAKAYIQAIDNIGVELRKKILTRQLGATSVDNMRIAEWIDLEEYGLSYALKIQSSANGDDYLEIPLKNIPNVYSWYQGSYSGLNTSVHIPWISVIRMLSIALYAGLRMQNCQWLDLRTFDSLWDEPDGKLLSSCLLFVNTDKNGQSRPSVISLDVMRSLLDEKEFQTNIYKTPVQPVFYENDPDDPQKYGLIHALFRSPWVESGMPFSDSTYALVWPKVLQGIEEVYNSLVPADRQHQFVAYGADGSLKAIHTPHALRATWITHMKIYGHLSISIIQGQVAHENAYTSNYYVVPSMQELMEQINLANAEVQGRARNKLQGLPENYQKPAIAREWGSNWNALAHTQNFMSVTSAVIEAETTGMQLIATSKNNPVGFYTNCVCVKNGDCPKQLTRFTGRDRVCGLCPVAIFGVDHLPGINCIMRRLAAQSEELALKLRNIKNSNAHPQEIENIHHELTVNKLELASYYHISKVLSKHLDASSNNGGLISRMRDLNNYTKHVVDMSDPAQRVISQVLDSSFFPQFAAEGYPHLIQKIAKDPQLLQMALADQDDKAMYTAQILTIMSSLGISIGELSAQLKDRHINLLDVA